MLDLITLVFANAFCLVLPLNLLFLSVNKFARTVGQVLNYF